MKKILITGASGFVGRSLAARFLLEPSLDVVLAIRKSVEATSDRATVVSVGDINGDTQWAHALQGVDIVVHAAARAHVLSESSANPSVEFRKTNVDGTLALARQAAEAGVKRFVFISSIGVNGAETREHSFTESSIVAPQAEYAFSKLEGENGLKKLLADYSMELVIIRPPLVYSACAPGNFKRLVKLVSARVPLPFLCVKNKRSLIALENLVDFIFVCSAHPKAANELFLISDGEDVSTADIVKRLGEGMGHKVRLFYVPRWIAVLGFTMIGRRSIYSQLYGSLVVDSSKAFDLLGWRPVLSPSLAIKLAGGNFKKT
ncbi:NAD-dependent epimerase/dehydratase family protein [Pseudomonas brenneri]|uniref:NAD-dependent epimerase/dehydratase family protein n=1 Tax=Pseudomonas fluorescens group TaxID=136843 RepID=UPI0009EAB4F2|nr:MULTISPECIES: NAD-dependent epimerase/dehydratase family protein [Pseudomonas fluorescens group]MBF8004357.1 NAD-dependent epimerase/dehydratase family protein [Pseudomonas brenneri]MDZ4304710.1 NAD-dependent epimerase/dehydratase family protein [Pseudomonas sp.]WJM89619.1 NAD-dependent epimerase/dehydratase family protein [Pseudomonas brenneri]